MKKTILLVDDEPNLRELLRHMLELGGFEVVEAENGVDGLEKAAICLPDIIILDVMMPFMDGVTMCKELRAMPEFAELPVIMLSGKTQLQAVEEGLAAGANQYLCKPITVDELIKNVRTFLPILSSASS